MTIKAVLFDMGFTLVRVNFAHPGEVWQKTLTSLDICKSLDDVKKAYLNAENEAKELDLLSSFGRMDREEYWLKWDTLVLKHLGIVENEELTKAVYSKWGSFVDYALYAEVEDVLSQLKKEGLKIGLISNAYEEEIDQVLQRAGLESTTFDVIVGVDTVGGMKPHPHIFQYAINKLGVKPEETIFVGDDVEADYKGAENAGLHALLVDRTEKKQSGLRTIRNLKEIFLSIKLISSRSHKNQSPDC